MLALFLFVAVLSSVSARKKDKWDMIFSATAGNGHNVYQAWKSGIGASENKPTAQERSCGGPHYRNPRINQWDRLDVRKVKLAFLEDQKEVAYVIFDGKNSNAMNWFSKDRVESSSWCDLKPEREFNFFSWEGDQRYKRTFYINVNYGGCDADFGYLVVTDTNNPKVCPWDKHPTYPQFLYSKINSADHWNQNRFGRAESMAVFIQK